MSASRDKQAVQFSYVNADGLYLPPLMFYKVKHCYGTWTWKVQFHIVPVILAG